MSAPLRKVFQLWRFRRFLFVGAALVGLTAVAGVSAHPPRPSPPYSVTLEDEYGSPLRTFHRDGTTFALGYLGERYRVRLTNHSDRRVEAVLSVDGRDAISGSPGDFVHQRGYIVPPYGSIVVSGFRQSLERAAAFRFSHPDASYSSRMGTPQNVGVIGVAFFGERWYFRRPTRPPYVPYDSFGDAARPRHPARERDESRRAAPAPTDESPRGTGRPGSAAKRHTSRTEDFDRAPDDDARAAPSRLGTEYGESTWSPVTEVSFQRENPARPDAVVSVRYDDANGLVARGFDVYPYPTWPAPTWSEPDPFPRNRFAPPPP